MGTMAESVLNEFRDEAVATRRMLERIPADKLSWKPHPKSRSLGALAMHVANLPGMAEKIAMSSEFAAGSNPPVMPNSVDEIRNAFEKNVRSGEEVLSRLTDETGRESWRLMFKGKEIIRKTRFAALRTNLLNHLYHHRGQLSVYLRLLDVPLPVVYGPTADENPFA